LQFPHLLFPNFHFENTLTQHNICKSEKKNKMGFIFCHAPIGCGDRVLAG
jgi:hypothetical protein